MLRPTAFMALLTMTIAVACSGGDEAASPGESPSSAPTPTPPAVQATNEQGEAPVFWRTDADFDALVVDESYKVLIRITNGFAEDTLGIDAVQQDGDGDLHLTSSRADPVGDDLPGSYYPTFFNFPSAGTWQVTIHAGDAEVAVKVTVVEAVEGVAGRY